MVKRAVDGSRRAEGLQELVDEPPNGLFPTPRDRNVRDVLGILANGGIGRVEATVSGSKCNLV